MNTSSTTNSPTISVTKSTSHISEDQSKYNRVPIFSLKVAQEMLRYNCRLLSIDHNSTFKGKLVFYFEKSETVKNIMLLHNSTIV